MIGHSEIRLTIDVKGLPVACTVCLQSLEPHKPLPFFAPLVNHRQVCLWFFAKMLVWSSARVRHHQKYLDQSTNTQWKDQLSEVLGPTGSIRVFDSHLLAHAEVSPSQSSIRADILVELETCLTPQIHSRARGCWPVSHSSHQTHARYLKHLKKWKKYS